MKTYTRVVAVCKTVWKKNPLSGHSWPEYEEPHSWEVRGPLGLISKHRTEEKAIAHQVEHEEFYQKYPPFPLSEF